MAPLHPVPGVWRDVNGQGFLFGREPEPTPFGSDQHLKEFGQLCRKLIEEAGGEG